MVQLLKFFKFSEPIITICYGQTGTSDVLIQKRLNVYEAPYTLGRFYIKTSDI